MPHRWQLGRVDPESAVATYLAKGGPEWPALRRSGLQNEADRADNKRKRYAMDSPNPNNSEAGFTLIELIVAASMMIVITGATVALLVSALRQQPEVTERADQIGDARNALEKLTVDIRQGSEATYVGPSEIGLETICDFPDGSTGPCTVEYECPASGTTYRCIRTVDGGSPTVVTRGLSSPDVFCVVPSTEGAECGESNGEPPAYVGVTIQFPATDRGANTVLEGGAALHNLSAEAG